MEASDAFVSKNVIQAMIINPSIPMSEYIRKEFYWNCLNKFNTAIGAHPAMIKEVI